MEMHPRPIDKVAIPRQSSRSVVRRARRVRLACETCRQRKTKCSGDTPVCRQCKEMRISCQYPLSWRDRTQGYVEYFLPLDPPSGCEGIRSLTDAGAPRRINHLFERIDEYESLLRDVGTYVDGRTADRIETMLSKYAVNNGDQSPLPQPKTSGAWTERNEEDTPSSPSSVGSLEANDCVEEDLNRSPGARATGYMGKNSEITWLRKVQGEAQEYSRQSTGLPEDEDETENTLPAVNYHLDQLEISVPGPVQVYQMPHQPIADHLFADYLETVHPFFPIINRPLFQSQYEKFFGDSVRPGDKWLAILNLIFAIAAKHAHLTQASWRGDKDDHLVYLTRARILSMNGDVLFSHPDLQQVQVEALTAFYLLACDHINRAWRIISMAIRSSVSLGLNLRDGSATTMPASKEARYRVWWCLYTFENLLGVMTGRTTCMADCISKTPFPLPLAEEQLSSPMATRLLTDQGFHQQFVESCLAFHHRYPLGGAQLSNPGNEEHRAWFKSLSPSRAMEYTYYVDLAVINQGTVNQVYSPDCCMIPWREIERRIQIQKARIDLWESNLPREYIIMSSLDRGSALDYGQLSLAFLFYSSRLTVGRPCLCRRDTQKEESFSRDIARMAVESACGMLDLIPDAPDARWLYQTCPWWCILHYVMQSAAVLLLELSWRCVHMPGTDETILQQCKKAVRWLAAMSIHSHASRRGWELCDSSLRRIAHGMGYDLSDMAPFPPALSTQPPVDQAEPEGPKMPSSPLSSSDFPFDPVTGEFVRSFFPMTEGQEEWD
ncbi:Zn(II)2Cys6 transcription factor, partial [Aspergillus affinis]|uniref:Zn(II)2Cys6 transcription factor n=1 Tax=Aspergillus affinis TaxID=1070780 RepID=UPI0022FF1BB4